MVHSSMFSSKTDQWATPQDLYERLDRIWRFDLDVAADAYNAKCVRYYDRAANGLERPWDGRVWCNPPYGRGIKDWVAKAVDEWRSGRATVVVMLIPARTDTAWWQDYVARYGGRYMLRGRLRFGDATNSAPFPSAIWVLGPPVSGDLPPGYWG